jgi:hypothetical protein
MSAMPVPPQLAQWLASSTAVALIVCCSAVASPVGSPRKQLKYPVFAAIAKSAWWLDYQAENPDAKSHFDTRIQPFRVVIFEIDSLVVMKAVTCLAVALLGSAQSGCSRCSHKSQDQPDTAVSATTAPSASPLTDSGTAMATDSGAGLAAVPLRQIPAGPAPNGTWTVAFGLERVAADENLDWSSAIAHCEDKGKQLCLETQWQRACDLDSEIGKLESWTLTADYPGAAVRGGVDGCKARSFHKIQEKNPQRIALCCDRAIAVTSDDKSDEFRTTATKRVLQFEATLRKAATEALSQIFAAKVSLDGNELDRGNALAQLAKDLKDDPDRLLFYDHCNVKTSTEEASPRLIADCGVILRNLGKTRGYSQRIVFAGLDGPVEYLGDPKGMKPKEQKERVKAFLPSE